jgi:hypothetical protein
VGERKYDWVKGIKRGRERLKEDGRGQKDRGNGGEERES